jgi:nucleotide-binding universal stress UspA family protein
MGGIMMLPLKKIVSPTDFSEPSYEGLKAAHELASHFGSELILIHVVGSVPVMPTPASTTFNVPLYQQEMVNHAREALQQLAERMIPKDIRLRPMVFQGDPGDEIVRLAEAEDADIIVIATHGRTGWRRFMFGSVAEKVVRLASCSVLTVQSMPKEE